MSSWQRLKNILIGLLTLLMAALLTVFPEEGLSVVASLLSLSLTLAGFRALGYYFTMSRHMVGGKAMLFVGIIDLDIGAVAAALVNHSRFYIILYLIGYHAFAGVIDVLRALEAKRFEGSWRLNMALGAVNLLLAAACLAFAGSPRILIYIYSAGLVSSACARIASAFEKTAIVYIQ